MAFLTDKELASLWDVVSMKRVQADRAAAAIRPAIDLCTEYVEVTGAWTWLPVGCLSSPQSWPMLAATQAVVDRTPGLAEQSGRGRCRIEGSANANKAGQPPLRRAAQLLGMALGAWSSWADSVCWAETRVVLFAPEGVAQDAWLDAVMSAWPDGMGANSIVSTPLSAEQWFDQCLSKSSGVKQFLLLSVNSRLSIPDCVTADSAHPPGECVSAIHVHRVASSGQGAAGGLRLYPAKKTTHEFRDVQLRFDTRDLERVFHDLEEGTAVTADSITGVVTDGAMTGNRFTQLVKFMGSELAACDPAQQIVGVAALAGDVGHSATLLTQLAVAYLLAAQREGAVLILDRYRPDVTAGWVLVR